MSEGKPTWDPLFRAHLPAAAACVALAVVAGVPAGAQQFLCAADLGATLAAQDFTPLQEASASQSVWHRGELTGDWMGERRMLESRGIKIGITWIGEGFDNFLGGIRTGTLATSTPDVNALFDLDKLIRLRGGEAFIRLQGHAGNNPSAVLVGDLQQITKLGSAPFVQIYDLWYQQNLFGGDLRIRAGKLDANRLFSAINNGLPFLNNSTQSPPTILGFPSYPNPSASINFLFTPKDPFYASFGIYNTGRNDRFLVFYGHPEDIQPTATGKFFIGETGLDWSRKPQLKSDRNLRLGFWGNTGTFMRFDGGAEQGARGFYAILDEVLWTPPHDRASGRGLRTFLEYGYANCDIGTICRHYGGGLLWRGPFAGRARDEIGFTAQYAGLSPQLHTPHSYELALEVFYRIELAPWAIIQPDVQYVIHPAGKYPSALVGIVFLQVKL